MSERRGGLKCPAGGECCRQHILVTHKGKPVAHIKWTLSAAGVSSLQSTAIKYRGVDCISSVGDTDQAI